MIFFLFEIVCPRTLYSSECPIDFDEKAFAIIKQCSKSSLFDFSKKVSAFIEFHSIVVYFVFRFFVPIYVFKLSLSEHAVVYLMMPAPELEDEP